MFFSVSLMKLKPSIYYFSIHFLLLYFSVSFFRAFSHSFMTAHLLGLECDLMLPLPLIMSIN